MQAKIHFLRTDAPRRHRNGFAMITAVFLMLLITMLLLKMLAFTADTQQRTIDEYLNEQAILLTYSATEYAVLAISGKDRSTGCLTTISAAYPSNGSDKMYDITTTIKYVWSDNAALGSDRLSLLPGSCKGTNLHAQVSTPEEHGAALIDVYVSSAPSLGLDEPIRFHRRTLQKL